MRVILADADAGAKIPNLALMQWSTYWRRQGATTTLYRQPVGRGVPVDEMNVADRVIVSCVFSWNSGVAHYIARTFRSLGAEVIVGGSGVDWGKNEGEWSHLPPEADACPPDYDLYGDDRAIGFCQRGCIRGCDFCLVKKKEGPMAGYPFRHPQHWVPDSLSKVLLLDNEFAAQPTYLQRDVVDWFHDTGRRYSITQGYDARILAPAKPGKEGDRGEELASILASWKPHPYKFTSQPRIQIAWDYFGIEPSVKKAVERLAAAGFRRKDICCYMVSGNPVAHSGLRPCGYAGGGWWCDHCHREAEHRFRVLARELGVFPFVMRFNQRRDDPWLNAFSRYVDRPGNWRNRSFEEYLQRKGTVTTPHGMYSIEPDGSALPLGAAESP